MTTPENPVPAQLCFTRVEFAQALRVSVRTVDRMIAAGEIRVRRVRGKAVRIRLSDVEHYLCGSHLPSGGTEMKTNEQQKTKPALKGLIALPKKT